MQYIQQFQVYMDSGLQLHQQTNTYMHEELQKTEYTMSESFCHLAAILEYISDLFIKLIPTQTYIVWKQEVSG